MVSSFAGRIFENSVACCVAHEVSELVLVYAAVPSIKNVKPCLTLHFLFCATGSWWRYSPAKNMPMYCLGSHMGRDSSSIRRRNFQLRSYHDTSSNPSSHPSLANWTDGALLALLVVQKLDPTFTNSSCETNLGSVCRWVASMPVMANRLASQGLSPLWTRNITNNNYCPIWATRT